MAHQSLRQSDAAHFQPWCLDGWVEGVETSEISQIESQRIEVLTKNVEDTRSLYKSSGSSYLEVLTAQQQLLSAQINKVTDDFNKMQAVVSLYTALGGGGK